MGDASMARRSKRRRWFDLETEAFSNEFRSARDDEQRFKHAPKMRLGCVYDGVGWHFFLPAQADQLLRLLLGAAEAISFNGKRFDELVLRRHHGLTGPFPSNGEHLDLCDQVFAR